jgi:hypothetical protein
MSGAFVTSVAVGTCTVTVQHNGDNDYLASPVVQKSFAIQPASQSITFTAPAARRGGRRRLQLRRRREPGDGVRHSVGIDTHRGGHVDAVHLHRRLEPHGHARRGRALPAHPRPGRQRHLCRRAHQQNRRIQHQREHRARRRPRSPRPSSCGERARRNSGSSWPPSGQRRLGRARTTTRPCDPRQPHG